MHLALANRVGSAVRAKTLVFLMMKSVFVMG
jgi:hypothetical protein